MPDSTTIDTNDARQQYSRAKGCCVSDRSALTSQGTVRIEIMPRYRQFGAPLRLKPGVQYMAVEIMSCANLPATDENGMTDCFVKVLRLHPLGDAPSSE